MERPDGECAMFGILDGAEILMFVTLSKPTAAMFFRWVSRSSSFPDKAGVLPDRIELSTSLLTMECSMPKICAIRSLFPVLE